ncbi:hypothetical protein SFUMM280S_09462 [Streptomyces fumanus]
MPGERVGAGGVRGAVAAEGAGGGGEGVLAGDQQGVEAGVLQGEPVGRPPVVVAGLAVVGGEADVAPVVEVGGPVGGPAVGQVGAAEGVRRGGLDAGEGAVPAGAVVGAGLPGVDDRREAPAAQVAAGEEVVVPGGEPGVEPGEEAPAAGPVGVRPVHQPGGQGVHGRLDDAGGLRGGGRARRVAGPGGPPEAGARKVGVLGDGGVEDDVRDPAVGPLGGEQRLQFALGAADREVAQADGDERRVPAPLVGVEGAGGHGGGAGPVAEEDPGGAPPQGLVRAGCGPDRPVGERGHAPDLPGGRAGSPDSRAGPGGWADGGTASPGSAASVRRGPVKGTTRSTDGSGRGMRVRLRRQ